MKTIPNGFKKTTMNNIAQIFDTKVSALLDSANHLKSLLGDTPVSSEIRDAFNSLLTSHENYLKYADNGNSDQILALIKAISIYGTSFSNLIGKMPTADDEIKLQAESVRKFAKELKEQAVNDQSTFSPLSKLPTPQHIRLGVAPDAYLKNIKNIQLEWDKKDEQLKRRLTESERRLVVTEESLKGLDQKAQEILSKIDKSYLETLGDLKTKKEEIDSILGHVSGRAIAGDFEISAASEKAAADWLRFASLFCMALIVGMLGYSFWETIKQDFQWQTSLFRVALAFLLSAPAAYLARESAKHRTQQYLHLQTSLDLKAISPYLASLPQEIQHRIKGEVAAKLFGGRDFSHVGADSYPINAQELLMELIKKLELPKAVPK